MEREQVLDVKLRSGAVRAGRRRLLAIALGVSFGTLFGAYVLWRTGEWALDRLVYENKAFAIQEFDIQTDGVIAVPQLRRWAGVKPEQNLLGLDLARVKRDLELVPLIESVSIERILPGTLRLRIAEREPIAQVTVPRARAGGGIELGVYLLDAAGWVMVPLDPQQRATPVNQATQSLPQLSGPKPSELQPGRRLEAPQVQAALQLIVSFDQSPMAGLADLRRIEVSAPEVLMVTTEQGSEVTFGLTDLDQQLRRWHTIVESGKRLGKAISSLDLAISNNIPARWLDASAVPPSTPRLPKPLHHKKKHV